MNRNIIIIYNIYIIYYNKLYILIIYYFSIDNYLHFLSPLMVKNLNVKSGKVGKWETSVFFLRLFKLFRWHVVRKNSCNTKNDYS